MPLYRVCKPGEQEVFPYLDENSFHQLTLFLQTLEEISQLKIIYKLFMAFLNRMPRHNTQSVELAAKIINDNLHDGFEFAQKNQWLFKCFYIKQKFELEFFPSYRPDHLTEETWGWLQRRILVFRYKNKFWIILPRP